MLLNHTWNNIATWLRYSKYYIIIYSVALNPKYIYGRDRMSKNATLYNFKIGCWQILMNNVIRYKIYMRSCKIMKDFGKVLKKAKDKII